MECGECDGMGFHKVVFCDECENFPPPEHPVWKNKANFQCLLDIWMRFKMPRSPVDEEWGFYQKECKKFSPKNWHNTALQPKVPNDRHFG